MKKKYLYNGQLMEEADVMDAAKQSNLGFEAYMQKAGIQVVDDNYSLNGKSFAAEDILDAANQSKLGFDDYIQKAGFQKKSQNGNGLSNGQQEPSEQPEATTSQLPEDRGLYNVDPRKYERKLDVKEENEFQSWLGSNRKEGKIPKGDYDFYKKNGYGYNYDFRAAFDRGEKPSISKVDGKWHWNDVGKKPNHPTFSDESVYNNVDGLKGGTWEGENFTPPQLPEDDYSGKRPAAYALPTQPKPGFKVQLNLGQEQPQEQPIAPVPKRAPQDILRDDYYANKVDIDKSLTSTVGDNPEFGKYVPNDSLFKALIDPRNGDPTLIAKYSKKRMRDLDNEFTNRKVQLEQKYTSPYGLPTEYYKELDELTKETDAKKKNIIDAVWDVAAEKNYSNEAKKIAEPKFVNKEMGRYMRRATGDPTLASEERREMKGIPLSPSEKYYNDKIGYLAKATVLKKMDDNGVDILNNPVAAKLYESVKDGKEKLLTDHKDFTRQQAAKLISDEISKDKNWFQLMTGAYTINDKNIEKYGKKLGLPDNITKQVHEGDIQTANVFGTFLNELGARPGARIGTFIGRPFRREILGQDPDAIDAHYEDLNKRFTTFLAENPDAQTQFSNPTEIQKDPTQENFLEDQRNAKPNKFNWSPAVIANSIANGAGQMIQYGLGGTATGGALKGVNKILGLASDAEKAKNVGLVTYGFMNSYEQGYQMGRQLIGDDPSKEGERNVIAALDAGVQAFTEMIFPDYKVTDKLFSVKNSGTQILLNQLAKYGPKALTHQTTKNALVSAIKQGVVNTAKDTFKEISEDQAGLLGDVVISAVANPKSLEGRDLPQEFLQTAITTAISAAVPIGVGEMRSGKHTSGVKKSMVHEIGSDPEPIIAHIAAEASDGKISQQFANKKISIVNTMSDIVKKDVPNISPVNGNPLSEMDKINYSYNLLHKTMLEQKLDATTDDVQQGIINEQLKELKLERKNILQNADGVEKNFNGQPIYDRDAGKVTPTPEEITKPIELSTETGTDYTGKDNNFLANKEPNFFSPQERETYNELMKKPETEEQAAQMVTDKKEELKKFATPPLSAKEQTEWDALPMAEKLKLAKQNLPEFDSRTDTELATIADARAKELLSKLHENATTIKPEEEVKTTEVAPAEVPATESFRSTEEAQKLIDEKVPFVKNYKKDVEFTDIVTGKTKTVKTFQAKEEMVKRYKMLNDLIVNCLT